MTRIFETIGALILTATISAVAYANPAYPARTTPPATATAANPNPQIRWLQESQGLSEQRRTYSAPYPAQWYQAPYDSYDPYPSYSYRNE